MHRIALVLLGLGPAAGCSTGDLPAARQSEVAGNPLTAGKEGAYHDGFAEHEAIVMSTRLTMVLPAGAVGDRAAHAVLAAFKTVEKDANEWRPGSPLAQVNAQAGGAPVHVPADTLDLVRRGLEIGKLTGGAFDITWAALWGLWDFRAAHAELPDPKVIAARLPKVDYRKVEIDPAASTIRLPEAGMAIGLGGIAKGAALARAAQALSKIGVLDYLLSAGGQVLAHGQRGGRPWRVGICDPRSESPNDYFAELDVQDRSVSTSGDDERYFVLNGKRYHHILDPRTGWPAQGLRSATVVSPDAILADALSTAMMVRGPDEGLALALKAGVEVVLVDRRGGLHMTPGAAAVVTIDRLPRR